MSAGGQRMPDGSYRYTVEHTDWFGTKRTYTSWGSKTFERARDHALELARANGWHPPRWYEIFRRWDYPQERDLIGGL